MAWIERALFERALFGHRRRRRYLGIAALIVAAATIIPAKALAQQPPPVAPPAPARPDLPPLPLPPVGQQPVQPAFSVVIDAAHGGVNTGARFSDGGVEKDMTLALSIRLRSALVARGIAVVTTRESDIDLSAEQRAGIANHARAAACLILHATATGSGVHLFTSSLPPANAVPQAMVPWQTAQAGWITRSLRLSSEINSALGQAGIPVTLGVASVAPIDNLTCPAVLVEIAPLTASAANRAVPIDDAKYQQRVLDALTAATLEWSTDWKQQP